MINVILIDDDSLLLDNYKIGLPWEKYGFFVEKTFSDSNAALEYIKYNKIDVIVTDIRMPDPDGLEIARICNMNFPDIKIIILSAYRDFEYAKTSVAYGVFRYLTKPIDYDEFSNALYLLSKEFEKQRSAFPKNETFEERYTIFSALLSGVIADPEELVTKLNEIGIQANSSSSPCLLINIHIENFDEYEKTIWKHGKITLYNAFGYLAPKDNDNAYFACTRYFFSNLEWLVIKKENNKQNDITIEEITEKFVLEFQKELYEILNIKMTVTFSEKHTSIFDLIRQLPKSPISEKTNNSIVDMAINYIKENFSDNITLDDVAYFVSMNASYFSVYFKQVTGKKFINYLTELKLNKAAELLTQTDLKISNICEDVGYKNQTHFYSIFNKFFGETPAEYRKKFKK